MKRANLNTLALLLVTVAATTRAQNYDIDWFNIAGGGGTSAGGTYCLVTGMAYNGIGLAVV